MSATLEFARASRWYGQVIALNDVAIDVLALELDSNRNAIYKNLFDARRRLRQSLGAAGHPVTDEEAGA